MAQYLPYLLNNFVGIGGEIKQRPEDFYVQELPLYEPSGDGEHVMAEIQKTGLSTFDAIDLIARNLRVDRRNIGYAGLKDAKAVTRQIITIAGTTPEHVSAFKTEKLSVLWAARHRNKLRLGHLAGNRFVVRVRQVDPTRVVTLRPAMQTLTERGVPNFFGEQRFGRRDNNDLLGAAFVRGDDREVLRLLLGDPNPAVDDPQSLEARLAFTEGDYERSIKALPHWAHAERRALARFIRTDNPMTAVMSVDMQVRRLWVTALQSRIFNEIVSARVHEIDRLMDGDVAIKHENGACFTVVDAAIEQPRADAFEISATGPMVGRRLTMPRGNPLEMETQLFLRYDISPDDFRSSTRDRSHGDRRPIRIRPTDMQCEGGVDPHGPYITLAFTLPPGAYATVLLRELMHNDAPADETENAPVESAD